MCGTDRLTTVCGADKSTPACGEDRLTPACGADRLTTACGARFRECTVDKFGEDVLSSQTVLIPLITSVMCVGSFLLEI